MLFGEYAVLHQQPCLVTAVDSRVNVSVEKIEGSNIMIETPKTRESRKNVSISIDDLINDRYQNEQTEFIVASIQKIFLRYKIEQGLRIRTSGPVQSYGLGSSSAVTVATIYATLSLLKIPFEKQLIFDLSYPAVLKVQKAGSGFDVASAVYGGTLFYQSDQKPELLSTGKLPLVIGYTGKKVSTTRLVQEVENKRMKDPDVFDFLFRTMGEIAQVAKTELLQNDWVRCGILADINQGLLDGLGVNADILERPIQAAREAGALGAKLSGAGGGDCMFAFVNESEKQKVETAIDSCGAQVVKLDTGSEGVRTEVQFA